MDKNRKFQFCVLLAVLAVLLSLYLIFSRFLTYAPGDSTETAEELLTPDSALLKLEDIGTSDEVTAVESDLQATDLNNLDSELQLIEGEL